MVFDTLVFLLCSLSPLFVLASSVILVETRNTAVEITRRSSPCSLGWCTTDTGGMIAGESMEHHMSQDTRILNITDYINRNVTSQVGDIVAFSPEGAANLSSGILSKLVLRHDPTLFAQYISNSHDGNWIGCLMVDRPSPDPDMRFESLLDESLFAGVPADLRAEVDPALLIPTPTSGCSPDQCFQIIPVSIQSHGYFSWHLMIRF